MEQGLGHLVLLAGGGQQNEAFAAGFRRLFGLLLLGL
jgi:hypothetical protein